MSGPWEDFKSVGPWEDFKPAEKKAIGAPEELSGLERFAASLPDWMAGSGGGVRGSAVGRLAMGAADPGVAALQMVANAIGAGDYVNRGIKETEDKYQAARAAEGSTGFDPMRMVGSTAMTLPLGLAGKAATTAGAMALKGAAQGGAQALLQPVVDGGVNFFADKAQQAGIGAVGGAIAAPLTAALARVISPRASVNPDLEMLRREGVRPTIGQALGGGANALEEKLQSVPIMGDMISSARRGALKDFNEAAINRATQPIGQSVKGAGQDAVAQAGDALSGAYKAALSKVKGIVFDTPEFNADLHGLTQLAGSLEPAHAARFERHLKSVVLNRMSPIGGMTSETFKQADSELGRLAAKYGKSQMAGEQELADAVREMQRIMREQVARTSPEMSQALGAANAGWSRLVPVEGAASRAALQEGVFTPGQLIQSIRSNNGNVRRRAVARGEAQLQDLATAAQNVIGNKYPDSGTAGRVMAAGGALASGMLHPAIPAAAVAGGAVYSRPIQNALLYMVSRRPDLAPQAAEMIRRFSGPAALAGGTYAESVR